MKEYILEAMIIVAYFILFCVFSYWFKDEYLRNVMGLCFTFSVIFFGIIELRRRKNVSKE